MKHKKKDALRCQKVSKQRLNRTNAKMSKTVRKGTIVRGAFMEVVDIKLKNVWKTGKEKMNKKKEWAIHKYASEEKEIDDVVNGVIVGDKLLEELEIKNKVLDNEIKASVYCDIKVSKEHQEILLLPPEHQTYPKLNLEEFETDLAKCVIKDRWEALRDTRKREESNVIKEITAMDPDKGVENTSDEVYDRNAKVMDIRNLKATDLKNNKRVILPELNEDENEIRNNHVRNELKDVFLKYKSKNCDKYGNVLKNNMSKSQMDAIRNLKTKISEENLVCYKTDKTGKLALDTVENYSNKMEKHIKNDKTVSAKELKKIENDLNNHADYWSRMTKAGEKTGQQKRIKGNVKTIDNQIPILSCPAKTTNNLLMRK